MTIFTTIFQGIGYLLAMGLANLFYYLGPGLERFVPPAHRDTYRRWAFRDPRFERAFEALTPGRQRSYLYHVAAAKQLATRRARIE